MREQNYWQKVMRSRIGRRRALIGAGGFVSAAAFLAACGGDDDSPSTSGGTSGSGSGSGSVQPTAATGGGGGGAAPSLITVPQDTTSQAVPGGVWVNRIARASDTYEPVAAVGSSGFTHTMPVYSKLAKWGKGINETLPTTAMVSGDAAESWEVTPDSLTYTVKMRRGHKFDPRPPTNGREMTTADLKFSMDRFAEGSAFRGEILNEVFPTGMVESMSYPDDFTAVIKLAYPYGPFPDVMAYYPYFNILPVEADGGFDPRSAMRGSGPFRLTEFEPDVRLVYEKNEDWYEPNRPFLDGIHQAILPEYASALAQFESGALWTLPDIAQEDILAVKDRHPEMVLSKDISLIKAPQFGFFQFTQKPDSPFRDARLRRAISMLIDREEIIDTFYNVLSFRAAGLPIEGNWNSHHFALQPNWIDPKNNPEELGEGGQYFQFNPEEAAKMLSAGGHDGFKFPFEYRQSATGPEYEAIAGMINQNSTLDADLTVIDRPKHREYQRSGGFGFEGMWPQTNGGHNEEAWFLNMYHPAGKYTVSSEPISVISDLALAIRQEPDLERQAEMIKDMQRELAMEMPNFLLPGYALDFSLHHPWLKNYSVFVSGDLNPNWSSARIYTEYWFDESEKS